MLGALSGALRHGAHPGGDDRARGPRLHDGVRRAQAHQLRAQRSVHDGRLRGLLLHEPGSAAPSTRSRRPCSARSPRWSRASALGILVERVAYRPLREAARRRGRSAASCAHHAARHRARHVGAPPEPGAAALHARAIAVVPAALRAARARRHLRRRGRRDGRRSSSSSTAPGSARRCARSRRTSRPRGSWASARPRHRVHVRARLVARGARRGALLPRSVAGLPDDGRRHRHARLRRRGARRHRQHPGRDARRAGSSASSASS